MDSQHDNLSRGSPRLMTSDRQILYPHIPLGPYARLRALGEGEGESRFGAAVSSRGSETRDEGLGSGVPHRGR